MTHDLMPTSCRIATYPAQCGLARRNCGLRHLSALKNLDFVRLTKVNPRRKTARRRWR